MKNIKLRVFKSNIDYSTTKEYLESYISIEGESLTHFQVMRILALVNCCAKPMSKETKKKYNLHDYEHRASSNFLQLYYKNYIKLLTILEGNELITFKFEQYLDKHTGLIKTNPIRIAVINPNYIKPTTVELNESDYKHMIIYPRKTSKLGNLHSYNKNIQVNIPKDIFEIEVSKHLMDKYPEKSPEQLRIDMDTQWDYISKINTTGHIQPHKTINGRCSSWITQISHPCDEYITIDGKDTIEFDQHATYLTLLPQVLDNRVSDKSDLFVKELASLRLLIENTPNLYVYIGNKIGVDMMEIKKEVNKFFCDPNASRTYKYKFFEFFNTYYPALSSSINLLRCKKGPYSDFNKIEAFIFSGAAKQLLKLNIPAITKYDSLIVRLQDFDIAKNILNKRFVKARISNKTKYNINKIEQYIKCRPNNQNGDNNDIATGAQGAEVAGRQDVLSPFCVSQKVRLQSSPTKSTWQVNRLSTIKQMKDLRWTISIKHKQINSKKNESFEDFKARVIELGGYL